MQFVYANTLAKLRILRLWHWQQAVSYRGTMQVIRTSTKYERSKRMQDQASQYAEWVMFHNKQVEILNEFFAENDTAMKDAIAHCDSRRALGTVK
jgi:hypothetical protein